MERTKERTREMCLDVGIGVGGFTYRCGQACQANAGLPICICGVFVSCLFLE